MGCPPRTRCLDRGTGPHRLGLTPSATRRVSLPAIVVGAGIKLLVKGENRGMGLVAEINASRDRLEWPLRDRGGQGPEDCAPANGCRGGVLVLPLLSKEEIEQPNKY
ncbi:hypothetical protein B296_00025291 [Ensete ventricosum]|uniref:Uncharacterized protein n=1 Tax=Ensete ventricosum TaxID=4639 RepID=A0A426ZL21_ENSVE|nr:hypothetical protein B296_00025291 [Ensete ventricosum]